MSWGFVNDSMRRMADNRSLLAKESLRDKLQGKVKYRRKAKLLFNDATPEDIQRIKEELRSEARRDRSIMILSLIMAVILLGILTILGISVFEHYYPD